MRYTIWKNGQQVEVSMANVKLDYTKKRLKELQGNVLHVINGEVVSVYKNFNSRVTFSHTFTREV